MTNRKKYEKMEGWGSNPLPWVDTKQEVISMTTWPQEIDYKIDWKSLAIHPFHFLSSRIDSTQCIECIGHDKMQIDDREKCILIYTLYCQNHDIYTG